MLREATNEVVGCGRCWGKVATPVQGAIGYRPSTPEPPKDPRPFREKLRDEGGKVLDLLDDAVTFLDAGARLWEKFRNRKP